jgi:16S rRNA C967 or C1407 C5-methylase (RsmB/RsmF family)
LFFKSHLKVAPQARVLNQAVDVYHLQDFDKGSCFVQDASAQLAAPLLNPKFCQNVDHPTNLVFVLCPEKA